MTAGPLWGRLDAVRSGRVHELDDDLVSGIGIQAAEEIVEQLDADLG